VGRHVVGEVRVQKDGHTVPLDGEGRVSGALVRVGRVLHEIQDSSREQQLPEPTGVGQVGLDGLPAQVAADEEPVGPADEPGLDDGKLRSFEVGKYRGRRTLFHLRMLIPRPEA